MRLLTSVSLCVCARGQMNEFDVVAVIIIITIIAMHLHVIHSRRDQSNVDNVCKRCCPTYQ